MGKELIMNRIYKVKTNSDSLFKGIYGVLIIYDALKNEATLEVEEDVRITTKSENLELVI